MAGNQSLAFGALIAGGLLITAALTGDSLAAVATGQANHLHNPSGTAGINAALAGAINSIDGLVNPFSAAHGLVPERVDQGQDFSMTPGSPILAIGDSKVAGVINDWYAGQPYIWYQLLNESGGSTPTPARPYAGQFWYVAEQITPTTTTVGTVIPAGQPVGHYASSGTGIEIGYAAASGDTLGHAHGNVDPSSHFSIDGQHFSELLKRLGVKV